MVWLTRRSSVASSAGRASITITLQPSGASIEANSHPITPPPTTIRLSGSSSISRSDVEVRTAGCSKSKSGRRAGSDPVATTTVGAEISRGAVVGLHRHPVGARQPAVAVHHPHPAPPQGLLHAPAHPAGHAHGPVAHDRPAHAHLPQRDAPVRRVAQLGHQLRAGEERLGGDAAAVDAGAPQQVALHQDGLGAELSGAQGGDVPGRPAAEHHHAGVGHAPAPYSAGIGGWRSTGERAAAPSSSRRTGVV